MDPFKEHPRPFTIEHNTEYTTWHKSDLKDQDQREKCKIDPKDAKADIGVLGRLLLCE
jgi:hypothetical protein